MPKKDKKKTRKQNSLLAAEKYQKLNMIEEEDTASIASDVTDSTGQNSDEENTIVEDDVYETKIKEAIDLASEKSAHTRTNALISLKIALQKRHVASFLVDNYQTIADIIERSLKKGRGLEQVAAAKLASVLVISLLGTADSEQVYKLLSPVLSVIVQDPTALSSVRQEAASCLAVIAFLACPEPNDLPNTLNTLHNIFCCSLPKGNGELPAHPQSLLSLHSASLQGVCLLLTLLSASTVYSMAPKMIEELVPVLMSSDLDLRIMVGEALALIYECARQHTEDFRWKKQTMLLDKLNDFVNESHKYRAKKDRKVQRSSFREIVHTIKEGEPFSETVAVGPSYHRQELLIDCWAIRFQYQALCHALEQGLNCHMTVNAALRDLFDLGPPPNPDKLKNLLHRGPKRPSRQAPEVKARLLARSKNRDNRAAALTYDD